MGEVTIMHACVINILSFRSTCPIDSSIGFISWESSEFDICGKILMTNKFQKRSCLIRDRMK